MAKQLAETLQGRSGSGQVAGNSAGQGKGNLPNNSSSESDQVADIGGLKISTSENIGVLYDNSSSMLPVDGYLQNTVTKYFITATVVNNDGCIAYYIPGDTRYEKTNDFYYRGEELAEEGHDQKPITALIMMSDWEDGGRAEATAAFVAALRARHVKLFILSVECAPYKGLSEYAQESGGQVSITSKLAIESKH